MLTIRFLKMRADPFDPSPIDIALTDGARGQMASGRVGNELGFDLIVLQRAEELIGLRHCHASVPSVGEQKSRRADGGGVGERGFVAECRLTVAGPGRSGDGM